MSKTKPSTGNRGRGALRTLTSLGVLCLAPFATAHAADTCESSFQTSGSMFTGKTFEAKTVVAGASARGAIGQMKSIAAAEGFDVGLDTLSGSQGTLPMEQKAQGNSRGFPLEFVANDQGEVSIKASLPAGMSAREKDMRTSMCGMLAKVKPRAADAAPAVAATPAGPGGGSAAPTGAPVVLPKPFSPEQSTELCALNFNDDLNAVAGTKANYATWTLTSSGENAHQALARVRALLAKDSNTKVVGEDYHGARGGLDIFLGGAVYVRTTVMDLPDPRPLSVRVEFDGDMGATSFVMRTYPKQQPLADRVQFTACSMLAAAAAGAAPPAPGEAGKAPRLRNPFKKAVDPMEEAKARGQRRQDGVDALYQRAMHAGKAFVVTPTLFMHSKYKGLGLDELREDKLVNYWLDQTEYVQWQNTTDRSSVIRVGNNETIAERGLAGYTYGYPGGGGKSNYLIFIVEPGTYELTSTHAEMRRAPMPDMSSKAWSDRPALGKVSFTATTDTEYYKSTEWQNAKFDTRTYTETYCQLVHMASGGCVGYGTTTRKVTEQVAAAGYVDVRHDRQVGGLLVDTELAKPFASFHVGKGEVAVVDGFVVDGTTASIDPDACKQTADDVATCALRSFNLLRVPTHKEHVTEWQNSGWVAPTVATLLGTAKAVPVTVNATTLPEKPGTFEAAWGHRTALKNK